MNWCNLIVNYVNLERKIGSFTILFFKISQFPFQKQHLSFQKNNFLIKLQTEKNYAQIEKEMLAIVFGCTRFHKLIYGSHNVIVESDHKPL